MNKMIHIFKIANLENNIMVKTVLHVTQSLSYQSLVDEAMLFSQSVGYMCTSFDFYCPTVGEYCLLFTPGEPEKTDEKHKYAKTIMLRHPLVRHNPLKFDTVKQPLNFRPTCKT